MRTVISQLLLPVLGLCFAVVAYSHCDSEYGKGPGDAKRYRYTVPLELWEKLKLKPAKGDVIDAVLIPIGSSGSIIKSTIGYMVRPPKWRQRWLVFDGRLTATTDLDKVKIFDESPVPPAENDVFVSKSGELTVLPLFDIGGGYWSSSNNLPVYSNGSPPTKEKPSNADAITIGFVESTDEDKHWGYPTQITFCHD